MVLFDGRDNFPIPLKIAYSHERFGPPSNTRFLGPSQIYSPNSILIGSAVFTWLTIATDHATPSVTIQYRDVQLRKDAEL